MDGVAVGQALRRVRLKRNERQQDVAERAGISRATFSIIERGHLDQVSVGTLRRACEALEVKLDFVVRWRGGDLDRLVHGRHAAMGALLVRRLTGVGWEIVPEASFNHFGERGVIDILAWHPARRALLIVELKTELVDANELLGTMDRRLRLARQIAEGRGWPAPDTVSAWVVFADSAMNRRRVQALDPLLRSAFPDDGHAARRWGLDPDRRQLALFFLSNSRETSAMQHLAPRKRVRRSRPSSDGGPSAL